jgi:ABC-2 type transport system permease protein
MKKLWLIIQREYISRITKKAFIIGTLLTPLLIGGFIFLQVKTMTYKDDNFKNIVVLDESGILTQPPTNQKNIHFSLTTEGLGEAKKQVVAKKYNGVLVIPKITDATKKNFTLKYYSDEKLGNDMSSDIENKIEDFIKSYKVTTLGLDTAKINALKTRVEIDPDPIEGTEDASTVSGFVAMGIGGMMGLLMYLSVFIYGMMIFRSVMEEKTSRIVEVMISSVKPFQLMLGKIIGVGAVGFSQIIIWFILTAAITTGISAMMGLDTSQVAASNPQMNGAMQNAQEIQAAGKMSLVLQELQNQNWALILPLFFVFFILGYLMYASLFAAAGSAVGDDQGEAQSLTLPITLPVVAAIYIMFAAVRSPDSSLAVWSSIFPLFSPIVMPARLPFHPPAWQIALSLIVLIGTVIGLIWIAGRIYRVGILMYGKKVTFKELGKWLFYKD